MGPDNPYGHRRSFPGYPPVYNQYGQSDRRWSSTSSQAASQTWQPQPYDSRIAGPRPSNQAGYATGNEWGGNIDLPTGPLPTSVTAGDLDLRELEGLSSSAHETPWSGAVPPFSSRPQSSPQYWRPTLNAPKAHTVAAQPAFEDYRRPPYKPAPSLTSIGEDSGFVSAPTLSAGYPDASEPNAQDLYPFQAGYPSATNNSAPPPHSVRSDPHPHGIHQPAKRRRSKGRVPDCRICGRSLRNHSDAVKHQQQHTKPFRCYQHGCTRKEGFATNNDLERHRKSVHGVSPSVGKKTVYVCQACPAPSPGTGPKKWPRLDNFKAHIGRKHTDWEAQVLIESSEQPRPQDAVSDPGYASQATHSVPAEDQRYQQDLFSPLDQGMSRHPSQQGDFTTLFGFDHGHQDQLAGVGVGAVADQFAGRRESGSRFHRPRTSAGSGMAVLYSAAAQQLASPVDSIMHSPMEARHSVPDLHVNGNVWSESQQQRLDQLQLGDRSPKRAKLTSSMDVLNSGNTSIDHTCSACGKIKKRECDLRKHMKRHTRPYGCTFSHCTKRFGSRNDWKRHENSQHYLQEMWRCEMKHEDGSKCGKLAHYENKAECKRMHLGREGHHHFWCGFCNELIDQPNSVQGGTWDARFKHIGDHFDKDSANINDWIDIEANKKKGLITREDRKKTKATRSRNGRFYDDDSDLGEDGILPSDYQTGYNTAPVPHALGGQSIERSAATGVYTPDKRRLNAGESDADGVSDDDLRV